MNDELVKTFEPLIKSIAMKFYDVSFDDLMQVGRIGLFQAYKHYESASNTKFSTFAYKYIFGEMYKYATENKVIKQNRDTLKLTKLVEKTKNYLTQTMGKVPTISDIAIYLEIDVNILEMAISSTQNILSLDMEEENDTNLYNKIIKNEDLDLSVDLNDSLNTLKSDEKKIIKYRYFSALTQQETAKIMGYSQVKVSRYEKKGLSKMKKYLACA